ncbi:MAG TPA: amidase family protein [Acidimicrobiia bacterium]|nr:amidase family protein [Acidimicrobiia bacterium]
MDTAFTSASDLARAIRAKEISSRELLDLFVARIERLNGPVNAVVTLDVDRARADADRADAAIARGDDVGPLHGLPVTIKDAIETAGIRSTGGAVELRDHVPATDAEAVARVKRAGAVVFGKTNVPRWSGDFQTYNEIFGTTNNPWDTARVPGGSSGGAAASVASGFTSFEIGTDIGGSVRIPSHCCGTFGLKPSFGVIPQRGYLDHVGGGTTDADINVFGPIARSAADLDLLLDVLAGPLPEQAAAWRLELPRARFDSVKGLRVGTWFDHPGAPVDREYRALLGAAADRLADAGAHVDDSHPPIDFTEQVTLFNAMILPAISVSLEPELQDALSGSHRAWLQLEAQRAEVRRVWSEWFDDHDLLLCPVLSVPAFPHDQAGDFMTRQVQVNGETRSYPELVSWAGLVGITGHPSAVPPIGRTEAGLPVGMQMVGGYLRDRDAIAGARIAEEIFGGFTAPPGFS